MDFLFVCLNFPLTTSTQAKAPVVTFPGLGWMTVGREAGVLVATVKYRGLCNYSAT